MKKFAFPVTAALLLAACAEKPVPEGYQGPLADVADTAVPVSGSSADVFYLSAVNGRTIDDSVRATATANAGRGFAMTPVAISRKIPAEPSTLRIVGQRIYAAPILSLMKPAYEVSGEIKFTPLPDGIYHVTGVLGKGGSAVWIEDEVKRERVSDKVELRNASAAGEH